MSNDDGQRKCIRLNIFKHLVDVFSILETACWILLPHAYGRSDLHMYIVDRLTYKSSAPDWGDAMSHPYFSLDGGGDSYYHT